MHGYTFVTLLTLLWITVGEEITTFEKKDGLQERPNFVILFADDIGWGDLGANWSPNKDVTPNLNKMAEEGLRMTDFHSGASVCTPSRAALLTGRIGLRTGVVQNFEEDSVAGLPLNETTIAEVLKDSGYQTGMIGKWHLGMTHKYHPRSRGFDFYYGLPYSNDMGCVDVKTFNKPQCIECPKTPSDLNETVGADGCAGFTALPLYDGYNIVEQPVNLTVLSDHYAQQAQKFIDSSSATEKPFLLYMAFAHMHVPLAHSSRFTNSTDVNTVYTDTLHELDDVIGRVINSLKQNGVYENTLIWFTGDNGPWAVKCEYSGSPGPFLGTWLKDTYGGGTTAKTSTWEAGHREPTVIVWPNKIKPNTTSDALASALDVFPTLVAAAGAKMPTMRNYDGVDLNDFLMGKSEQTRNVIFHPNSGDTPPSGEIDTMRIKQYKIFWKTGGVDPDCNGKDAPVVEHDPPLVFDVVSDPAESTPLTKTSAPNIDEIIANANQLRDALLLNIKSDNTSVADYGQSPSALPCCDPTKFYCRCQKDGHHLKFNL